MIVITNDDMIGKKFNRLTVLSYAGSLKSGRKYNCLCDCGKETIVYGSKLRLNQTKSCGCWKSEQSRTIIEHVRPDLFLGYGVAPANQVYNRYKHAARLNNRVFELTKQEWLNLVSRNCFYCNSTPNNKVYSKHDKNNFFVYNGIDRLDNSIGYVLNNCVPCCVICNRAKGSLTLAEFLEWIEKIKGTVVV